MRHRTRLSTVRGGSRTDPDAGSTWRPDYGRPIRLSADRPLTMDAVRARHPAARPVARERLNHWVDTKAPGSFAPGVWAACRAAGAIGRAGRPFALGIREHPGWERATIAVAGVREDGRIGVEVYRDLRATDGPVTAERIIAEVDAFPEPVRVIAYPMESGAAAAFRRHADETGQPWDELKPAAIVSACMDTAEMIQSRRLAVDDPLIDAQIAGTARRSVGQDGAFRWSVKDSIGPIDAVYAMTFAAHAIAYSERSNIFI